MEAHVIPIEFDDVGIILAYVFNLLYEFRDIVILLFLVDLFFIIVRTVMEAFGLISAGAGQQEVSHQYQKHRG
jgi:hypothetical protein